MTIDKAYLVGTSVSSYKAGVPGEIIGVILIKPNKNSEERLCYCVKWHDSSIDYIAVKDDSNYKIISFTDILNNNIPEID